MKKMYQRVTACMVRSGKRLAGKLGSLADIGVTKKYLTNEDIRIERELRALIAQFGQAHAVFGEEENSSFSDAPNVWVIDPISGTSTLLAGIPHFAIVVSHLYRGAVQFAAVYDPVMKELFTAFRRQGAFLNGRRLKILPTLREWPRVVFHYEVPWNGSRIVKRFFTNLLDAYKPYRTRDSCAIHYCYVACGRYDGVIASTKDAFPEFAGSLIIQEAGGQFTNAAGATQIAPSDRLFIGGNRKIYAELMSIVKKLV